MPKIIDKPVLPKEIFNVEVKPALLAQAVRVYLANQRQGNQSALTRAEVNRTRKKFQKQKGSGHARHGDRKSPIFVGGGIAFAPKPRDYSLNLSGPMKTKAKLGALSNASKEKKILVVSGLDKLSGKTKELADYFVSLDSEMRNWLVITDELRDNVYRAGRNIPYVEIAPANLVNTYQIVKAGKILVMEEAVEKLSKSVTQLPSKSIKNESIKKIKSESKDIKKSVVSKVPVKTKKISRKSVKI